jgi:hypothetical protein
MEVLGIAAGSSIVARSSINDSDTATNGKTATATNRTAARSQKSTAAWCDANLTRIGWMNFFGLIRIIR